MKTQPSKISHHIASISLLLALSSTLGLSQQSTPAASEHVWAASWITSAEAPFRGEAVLHLRKAFVLATQPTKYVVHVSADNQFELRVNGKFVDIGPSHSDLQHWKYETYDIAALLHPGNNLIGATVWNFGEASPVRQISDRTGFVLDGDTEKEALVRTDASWEVELEPGISTIAKPPILWSNYYVASPGERIDGRLYDWSWDALSATSSMPSTWKPARVLGEASARGTAFSSTNWQLMSDSLPAMERIEQDKGKTVRMSGFIQADGGLTVPAHTSATLLIDQGQLTTAYPELIVSEGKDSLIKLYYAEALYDAKGQKGDRNDIAGKHIDGLLDEVRPDGGDNRSYVPLEWRTWRYLQVDITTGDEELRLDQVRSVFSAYPFKEVANFDSDDASLRKIWDIGWRTARLCAHDTYMDTPYWERLQYTGDTRIESLISYVVTGDDRLARQAIDAFHNSATSDGITLSRYPASGFQNIPGFSLYWIGMVHDYWMYRPDHDFVRAQLPLVRSSIDWFLSKRNPNGLVGKLPWWPFVDWSDGFTQGIPPQNQQGDSAILSLQLVEALRYAAGLETALGDKEFSRSDERRANEIAAAVWKLCWNDQLRLLADTPEKTHFSQHTNAYGVWLDVVPRKIQNDVMTRILAPPGASLGVTATNPNISQASYYYRFYLARALSHAGMGDLYLDTLGPWKTMISNGLTTWAEQPEPTRSDSHAWSSHPNYDLLTLVAGISPAEPGFKSVRIEPHLGALKHIQATMASPNGAIQVDFEVTGKKVEAAVTLPAGLDGKLVWNKRSIRLASGTQHLLLPEAKESLPVH